MGPIAVFLLAWLWLVVMTATYETRWYDRIDTHTHTHTYVHTHTLSQASIGQKSSPREQEVPKTQTNTTLPCATLLTHMNVYAHPYLWYRTHILIYVLSFFFLSFIRISSSLISLLQKRARDGHTCNATSFTLSNGNTHTHTLSLSLCFPSYTHTHIYIHQVTPSSIFSFFSLPCLLKPHKVLACVYSTRTCQLSHSGISSTRPSSFSRSPLGSR